MKSAHGKGGPMKLSYFNPIVYSCETLAGALGLGLAKDPGPYAGQLFKAGEVVGYIVRQGGFKTTDKEKNIGKFHPGAVAIRPDVSLGARLISCRS